LRQVPGDGGDELGPRDPPVAVAVHGLVEGGGLRVAEVQGEALGRPLERERERERERAVGKNRQRAVRESR
jgi:hypothetical protein